MGTIGNAWNHDPSLTYHPLTHSFTLSPTPSFIHSLTHSVALSLLSSLTPTYLLSSTPHTHIPAFLPACVPCRHCLPASLPTYPPNHIHTHSPKWGPHTHIHTYPPFAPSLLSFLLSLYYTSLALGSPPQLFNVQVDTGSDLLWVACQPCLHCAAASSITVSQSMNVMLTVH